MRYLIPIALFVMLFCGSLMAAEEGYDATIKDKAGIYLNDEEIATIPASALFHVTKVRDNWVLGTYTDVDTDKEISGWIEMKHILDLKKTLAALKIEAKNYLIDGERRYQEKRYRDAIGLLTESLDRYPNQPHALMLRAESYRAVNDIPALIGDLSTVIVLSPVSDEGIEASLSRADLYIKARKLPEAVADLRRVLAARPNEAEAYLYLGDVQYLLGKYRQAAVLYMRGINSGGNIGQLHYKLGLSYFQMNMFDEAISQLKRAIELRPNNTEYAKALRAVNDRVEYLSSVTPEQIKRMLEVQVAEKDDQLLVAIANKSARPLIDVEVALVPFIEDTFERQKDEFLGEGDGRNIPRGALRRDERTKPVGTEIQQISYFSGTPVSMRPIQRVLKGKPFSDELMDGGMDYVGYIVMVFVNKREVYLISEPRWLADDFKDVIMDVRVDVQGPEMK